MIRMETSLKLIFLRDMMQTDNQNNIYIYREFDGKGEWNAIIKCFMYMLKIAIHIHYDFWPALWIDCTLLHRQNIYMYLNDYIEVKCYWNSTNWMPSNDICCGIMVTLAHSLI